MEMSVVLPQLGDTVKDSISGFEGVVIGITEWIYGCRRCGVQPKILHDGKPIPAEWFDSPQLHVIERNGEPIGKDPKAPGGPRDDRASARKDPTR